MDVYWLERRQSDVPEDNHWLNASEAACLNALRFPKRRADWRLGRWTAKRALSVYLKAPGDPQSLADIEIRAAASGAPEAFVGGQIASASISLSHSNGIALCAIAPLGTALGCDLELIEPRSEAFVTDYFTDHEQAWVTRASASDRPLLATLLWSAKESALKALHEGLRLDTRSVIVSFRDVSNVSGTEPFEDASWSLPRNRGNDWHSLQVRYTEGRVFHGWWQRTGELLRTLVATPPPIMPIALEVPTFGSSY